VITRVMYFKFILCLSLCHLLAFRFGFRVTYMWEEPGRKSNYQEAHSLEQCLALINPESPSWHYTSNVDNSCEL
jgi:hypothetical protein